MIERTDAQRMARSLEEPQAFSGLFDRHASALLYGDRVYEALDLEGHRWSFHPYTGRRFGDREWATDDEGGSS